MSRTGGIVLTVVAIAAIGVGGYLAIDALSTDQPAADEPAETSSSVEMGTATVMRTDIVETDTLEGLLQFRDPGVLLAAAPGTVTGLPEGGSVLRRGDTAYELDGTDVITFIGERPMWRIIESGVPNGHDIAQLEANLATLGFDDDGEMTVDEEFTESTSAAIGLWQESLGRDNTGIVTPADLVFIPTQRRVGESLVGVGAVVIPGTPLFATSARDHEVVVLLDADRQDLLAPGDEVTVELAEGTTTSATVGDVSRVVTTVGEPPDTRRVVEVRVDLVDESFAGDVDATPVDVDVETSRATGVLVVPVEALLALAEGGYAVEVDTGGDTRLVAVEIGGFADGLVEVTGDIAEGDTVLVPT